MKAEDILSSEDFKKCVDFHGHICPGLSIGYRASKTGLDWLKENRASDEEIVAIVETDACCADAVQVMTGCTFGKGNFIYKDHGKIVFTFLSRQSGNGVRIALKYGAFRPDDEHLRLIEKNVNGTATDEEQERFREIHFQKSCDILEKPLESLFTISSTNIQMPKKATIEPSKPCDRCGEPTMASKLRQVNGESVCRDCLD
ncbi:FmdE family protein [Desulfonema magnum]|uniref:Molybdenum formylmethanofuran dehydrogenase domain-containing protein n=1 Tax=Desulfonema magnum TaxID=45655 RepID=A0A975GPL3_9BACT|nr:FmdE family protein [Desulfonema magnum]QTA88949.1 Molybdenum formylmethanofuran dehydrogenase domain-containing protein [Desulfonema magnum]